MNVTLVLKEAKVKNILLHAWRRVSYVRRKMKSSKTNLNIIYIYLFEIILEFN